MGDVGKDPPLTHPDSHGIAALILRQTAMDLFPGQIQDNVNLPHHIYHTKTGLMAIFLIHIVKLLYFS